MSDRAICSILSTDWKGKVMRVIVIQAFVPSPFHQSLRYVKIKKKMKIIKEERRFFGHVRVFCWSLSFPLCML